MAVSKLKTKAQIAVPQSRDDAADAIFKIGAAQRELKTLELEYEAITAEFRAKHQPTIDAIKERVKDLSEGVQTWCEAHRVEITDNGKVKFANLVTGEVKWRQNPPSVRVTKAEQVIEALRGFGLDRFIRPGKPEVNKDAILEEPDAVKGVAGISILTGVEQFEIVPFEQELAA